ncbi:MAG TPA: stage III sporulation protein AA [Pseudogracilibacillus sp.]|nr:stage III sporulation protein AA [Pseudogracilibacillus sp.]
METIKHILPPSICEAIEKRIVNRWRLLEEIRLRIHLPIELSFFSSVDWLHETVFTEEDCTYVLRQLSEHSLYRLEDELRNGYITITGGHRVGLAGEVVTDHASVSHIEHVTFFNIRIAREVKNVAQAYMPFLRNKTNYYNTLIVGAPQTGKTTLLRDMARMISDGSEHMRGQKVAIIDERSEIGASKDGVPQFYIGKRSDIMDACPKVDGIMMMIRSMSPDVLIVDEIGTTKDVEAILEATLAGVTVICTVHSATFEEVRKRPSLQPIFQMNTFKRIILLTKPYADKYHIDIFTDEGKKLLRDFVQKR